MREIIQYCWKVYLKIINSSCKIKATEVGRNLKLNKHVTLEKGCHIYAEEIGKYTFINKNCIIDKSVKSIGKFCSIAYGVKIGLGTHPTSWASTHPFAFDKKYGFVLKNEFEVASTAPECIIGNDVWIGANAIILAGVKIGDGAIIGANSFVNKNVEPYSIVNGTPARHQKYRFEQETIENLLKIEWWNWEEKKIKKHIDLFKQPENLISQLM